jgi:imidazolonepropionase-like amidohydrolase
MRTVEILRTLLLISLCMVFASTAAAQFEKNPPQIIITHVTVINPGTSSVQPDSTVVITGARITAVSNARNFQPPKNARVIDGKGQYLIPGLWDMHVHSAFGD